MADNLNCQGNIKMAKKMDLITYVKSMDADAKLYNPLYNDGYQYTDTELEQWCNATCHMLTKYADEQFKSANIKYKTLIVLLTNWASWYYYHIGNENMSKFFAARYERYDRMLFNTKMTEDERSKVFITLD